MERNKTSDLKTDALRAARITHDVMLTTMTIVAGFLLSGTESTAPYDAAIQELEALRNVPQEMEKFKAECTSRLDQDVSDEVAVVAEHLQHLGWRLPEQPISGHRAYPHNLFLPPVESDVKTLCDWFRNGPHHRPVRLSVYQATAKADQQPEASLDGITTINGPWPHFPTDADSWEFVDVDQWLAAGLTESEPRRAQLRIAAQTYSPFSASKVHFADESLQAHTWLEQKGIVNAIRPNGRWFPSLRAVQELVEHRSVESAIRYLHEIRQTQKRQLTFGPVSLDVKTIGNLVPPLLAALLACQWLHLRIVRNLTSPPITVSWLPAFDTTAHRVYAAVSLLIAPIGLSLLAIWFSTFAPMRQAAKLDWAGAFMAVAMIVCVVCASIACFRGVRAIRQPPSD